MPRITLVSASRLRKVFERAGFRCVRIEGDHFVYTKSGILRLVIIPDWGEVPVFIIKNNLSTTLLKFCLKLARFILNGVKENQH
ncbi:MAG: type II toxin-antitoxin system HicA family toxin [Candidatus Edwardsbacteria bacterium]